MKNVKRKKNAVKKGHLLGRSQEDADAVNLVMFDPGDQHLDLTKGEKLRTTALLMAINYVKETICQDAEMYRALRQDGKELVPATVPWVIQCSVEFEDFLLGRYTRANVGLVQIGAEAERARQKKESGRSTATESQSSQQSSESSDAAGAVDPVEGIVTG